MSPCPRRSVAALAAAIIGLTAPFASLQAQTPRLSDNEVRIGVLTDMGSFVSDASGVGSVLMAQLAIDDFIAADKPAFRIKLLQADMQLKPDVASSVARSWFDQDGVDMITDVPMSAAVLAVIKLAEEKNRFVMTTASSQRITNEECSPNAVQWVVDSYAQAFSTAAAMTRSGADSWFIVRMDTAGGKALQDDISAGVRSEGGKVIGEIGHPQGVSDFSSYAVQAQASKARAIALANSTVDTSSFIKQAGEYGIAGKQALVASILHALDIHGLGLELTQGLSVSDAFYWDRTPESRALSQRFFDKRKKMPTYAQVGVYSATLQYLRAVKGAGTDEAKAVAAHLRSMTISDAVFPSGKLRPDGKMVHDMYLLEVKKPGESKYPWDYMTVKAVIPAEKAFLPLSKSTCKHVKP